MIDAVLETVTTALCDAGIAAYREFPSRLADGGELCVTVGARKAMCRSPGLGDYLGIRTASGGEWLELYGKRLELDLVFEIFSPYDGGRGAEACVSCADELQILAGAFPASVRTTEFSVGEVSADEGLAAFRCECTASCVAFFVAESGGDSGEFLDFILKGVVDGVSK